MDVVFMSHPVGAYTDHAGVAHSVGDNLQRAFRWYKALRRIEPGAEIVAPWLLPLLFGIDDDGDPAARERGIAGSAATAARCNGIVLVGGILSAGMERELVGLTRAGGWVSDLLGCGNEPPPSCFAGDLLARGRVAWGLR